MRWDTRDRRPGTAAPTPRRLDLAYARTRSPVLDASPASGDRGGSARNGDARDREQALVTVRFDTGRPRSESGPTAWVLRWPSGSAVDDRPDTRDQIASLRSAPPPSARTENDGRVPWPVRTCPSSSVAGASSGPADTSAPSRSLPPGLLAVGASADAQTGECEARSVEGSRREAPALLERRPVVNLRSIHAQAQSGRKPEQSTRIQLIRPSLSV